MIEEVTEDNEIDRTIRRLSWYIMASGLVALVIWGCAALAGCATHLTAIDQRALLNQERACEAIATRANVSGDGPTDSRGAITSLAEACYCGASGILKRAKAPNDIDGGSITCP